MYFQLIFKTVCSITDNDMWRTSFPPLFRLRSNHFVVKKEKEKMFFLLLVPHTANSQLDYSKNVFTHAISLHTYPGLEGHLEYARGLPAVTPPEVCRKPTGKR